jgi:uncharacterized membrane protein SpoIIM required for sporulation
MINSEQFIRTRQTDWNHLAYLLEKSKNGVRHLSPDEIKLLGNLYRTATSDLALAQREFPQHRVTRYLNQLVGRGHALIYHGEPLSVKRLGDFFVAGFPQRFRQTLPFFLVTAILLVLPALLVGGAVYRQPAAAQWLLPAAVLPLIDGIERQELWVDIAVEERPYASSFIMTNNIQVSFLAFAGGITAGLLTVYVLINNGALLGGLTGLTAAHDVGFELWTFVIGHGVIELTTICIAGAAGLMLGWAILQPGLLRRRDALILASRQALALILGCVPLLVIAGLIEGFISPNESIPWPVKWGVGLVSGLLLYSYLLLAGREHGKTP